MGRRSRAQPGSPGRLLTRMTHDPVRKEGAHEGTRGSLVQAGDAI